MDDQVDKQPNQPMMAERDTCEHAYAYHIRGGAKLSVGICVLCKTIDFEDLNEQAAEFERAGYARAVTNVRDDGAYLRWWHAPAARHGGLFVGTADALNIANYLEAVERGDFSEWPDQAFPDRRAAADPSVDHASHSMGWVDGCAECPQDYAAVVGGQPEQKEITDE